MTERLEKRELLHDGDLQWSAAVSWLLKLQYHCELKAPVNVVNGGAAIREPDTNVLRRASFYEYESIRANGGRADASDQ